MQQPAHWSPGVPALRYLIGRATLALAWRSTMGELGGSSVWNVLPDIDPGDVGGYSIHAIDGDIGKVDKHDMDAGRSCLLVATGTWIFGKTVMLPAGVIERIDHESETVFVSSTKNEIKHAPEYHEGGADDNAQRDELTGYYGGL
jgi:hypothetical protein